MVCECFSCLFLFTVFPPLNETTYLFLEYPPPFSQASLVGEVMR